ncbi:MAG: PilZ domain-containing protein [Candidatus Aminicenantes bacterium]|nr:PilZ domain-containing protein [Candidatus Aminicenantes bacterium]
MSDEREERRESSRIFFALKDNIGATIQTHAGSLISLPVSIISVSSGGFGFVCGKEKVQDIIKVGDRITITDIQTPPPLGPLATLEVEVKHVQEHESDNRIAFGSSFSKISDALRNKIQNFVEYRHSTEANGKK